MEGVRRSNVGGGATAGRHWNRPATNGEGNGGRSGGRNRRSRELHGSAGAKDGGVSLGTGWTAVRSRRTTIQGVGSVPVGPLLVEGRWLKNVLIPPTLVLQVFQF